MCVWVQIQKGLLALLAEEIEGNGERDNYALRTNYYRGDYIEALNLQDIGHAEPPEMYAPSSWNEINNTIFQVTEPPRTLEIIGVFILRRISCFELFTDS